MSDARRGSTSGGGRPSSIVALHGGALGDFVLTHHLLAILGRLAGVLRIDVVARSPLARWSIGRGVVGQAPEYETFGLEQLFGATEPGDMPVAERLGEYDLVLSFLGDGGSIPSRAMARAGLAAVNIDPNPNGSTDHIVLQWLRSLASQVVWCDVAELDSVAFHVGSDERRSARVKLGAVTGCDSGPYVLVHPGAGSRAKCCPVQILGSMAERLVARGCGVAWMVGPTELDWHGAAWVAGLEAVAPVLFEDRVTDAVAALLGADLYIGNDAGMTHVAAAVGVETVTLFGPTDERVWSPRGRSVNLVRCGRSFGGISVDSLWPVVMGRLNAVLYNVTLR